MRRDGGSGDVDTTWSRPRHPTNHCHRVPVGDAGRQTRRGRRRPASTESRSSRTTSSHRRPHRRRVTRSSTHRLRGRWRLIRDGVQLAKPAAREMIWSKSDTFRPGDPRAASQPRIAAGCVARLPRESRRLGKSAVDASAWPRHYGRSQLESSLCRPVPTVPRGRARSTGPRSRHSAMAEIQP